MRYIKFYGGTPFCGTDYEEYEVFEDNITDEYLDEEADDRSRSNAESYENIGVDYGIYEEDFDSYDEYEEALCEASDEYYAESYGHWEEISKEEYEEMS